MTRALVLIDLQNDYVPGGAMQLVGAEAAASQAARLLRAFRQSALPIVHIQHIAEPTRATFFLPGTTGAEIRPEVSPAEGETLVVKHFPQQSTQSAEAPSISGGYNGSAAGPKVLALAVATSASRAAHSRP